MEVQGRPVHAPRGLLTALARVRERAGLALAVAAAAAAALAIVAAQPVRSPWWTYADADATYVGAGANMLAGAPARYLDHPGLPLQELLAVSFGLGEAVERLSGGSGGIAYVDELLLDVERTRPVFRGLAIAFYLAGGLLSAFLLARLLEHWGWGLAGGLLWIGVPGLVAMSIQYRPDVPLAVLALVFAFLVGRAVETRSPLLYAAAAATAGLAVMVKLHAAGLLVPLALAAVWRPPGPGWEERARRETRDALRRARPWLVPVGAVWLIAALLLNRRHLPFTPSWEQLVATLAPPLAVVVLRLLHPFLALVAGGFVAGLLLPVTLDVPDGMRALVYVANGLAGRGINQDVEVFGAGLSVVSGTSLPLFLVLAAVAAVVGIRRRDPRPAVWLTGAVALAVMAQARPPAPHYFAPAFVLCVPAALWLLRTGRGVLVPTAAAALVAYAVLPALDARHAPAEEAALFERSARPALAAVETRLRPGEVALVPSNWPTGDSRYFEWVENVVAYVPEYPYRFLPDTESGRREAEERGLRIRYRLDGMR